MDALLTMVLVAYNNALNLWPRFHTPLYVPLNVAAGAVVLGVAAAADLGATDLGLSFAGIGWGLVPVAAAAAVVAAVLASPRWRALLADERLRDAAGSGAAFMVLVRIPVGTALFEEVCFRGVVFAAFAKHGSLAAAWVSSAAFGLWHVVPAMLLVRANRPAAGRAGTAAIVAGGVVATTTAGFALAWLRVATGGIAAPAVAHAGVNMIGALGAIAAHRAGGVGYADPP